MVVGRWRMHEQWKRVVKEKEWCIRGGYGWYSFFAFLLFDSIKVIDSLFLSPPHFHLILWTSYVKDTDNNSGGGLCTVGD